MFIQQTVHHIGTAPAYSPRAETHNKALIDKTAHLSERNFLIRVLYKDCYWLLKLSDMYVYIS